MNAKRDRKADVMKDLLTKWGTMLVIILAITLLISSSIVSGSGSSWVKKTDSSSAGGTVRIDGMKQFGNLSEPEVYFPHDAHTETLLTGEKDCFLCHLNDDGTINYHFKRVDDVDRLQVMDTYHTNCITCHESMSESNAPIACRDCHSKTRPQLSDRDHVQFNNSLHFRHTAATENKCELCHHVYDENTKKRVYKKGSETSCRQCHGSKQEENRISLQSAAHKACIECHMSLAEKKKNSGPVNCTGCHDAESLKTIKTVKPAPVINLQQPDFILMKPVDKKDANRMNSVPFNHKNHEQKNDTCRVCHHKEISKCGSCHSIDGKPEGGNISLEKAMHNTDAQQSCIGCHNAVKKQPECLGCHSFIDDRRKSDKDSCRSCHNFIEKNADTSSTEKNQSSQLQELRGTKGRVYDLKKIPETIRINRLEDHYAPCDFPHRKVVTTLVESTQGNKLADYYHSENGGICHSCHHKQPPTEKPSACVTCHDATKTDSDGRPGLKGAYHIQCMECHDQMKIEKNSCTDCHKKKKKP